MSVFILLVSILCVAVLMLCLRGFWPTQKTLAICLFIFSTSLIAVLYQHFGRPEAINYQTRNAEPTLTQALNELKQVTLNEPNNFEAQVLYARAMMQLNRFSEAEQSYHAALQLQPNNSSIMVDYAESLFRNSNPNQANTQAQLWIDKALSIDRNNQRALFFQGVLLMQAKQPKKAAAVWETLLPMLDEKTANALLPQINRARAQTGLSALPIVPQQVLDIQLDLDPAFKTQAPPSTVVFVFAQAIDHIGPPIAAKRIEAKQFPIRVQLSNSDSIMPNSTLFSHPTFILSAKISASGSATPSADDWRSKAVSMDRQNVHPIHLILSPRHE